jgi:hypothetical protein
LLACSGELLLLGGQRLARLRLDRSFIDRGGSGHIGRKGCAGRHHIDVRRLLASRARGYLALGVGGALCK